MTETETPRPDDHQEPEQQERRETREDLLAGVGRRLREVREQRQLGTEEIARELKLRAAYLTALENGDWSTLPGDIYGIGFARQYARYLGLDMEEDITRISSGEYQLTKPLTFPDPPIAPAKRWAVTGALLFILLFIAFNVFRSAVHKHEQSPAPTAVRPAAPPPPAPATKAAAKPAPSTPVATPASKPAAAHPIPTAKPATEATSEPAQGSTTPSAPASAPTAATKSAYAHRYRFEAVSGDVWLQLYDGPNNLVKEALLRQGQHMDIDTDAAALTMDCGNVGAIAISIDGKPVVSAGQLGPIGKVIHDYALKAPAP